MSIKTIVEISKIETGYNAAIIQSDDSSIHIIANILCDDFTLSAKFNNVILLKNYETIATIFDAELITK